MVKKNLKINEVDINFKKRSFEKSKFNFKVIWLFLGKWSIQNLLKKNKYTL